MTTFFVFYMLGWSLACLAAIYFMIRHRSSIALFQARYWRFLFQDWKIISFIFAAIGLTVVAPYTGDPTWDYVDALFMSVLTFATDKPMWPYASGCSQQVGPTTYTSCYEMVPILLHGCLIYLPLPFFMSPPVFFGIWSGRRNEESLSDLWNQVGLR
jgi:hypothetical protein